MWTLAAKMSVKGGQLFRLLLLLVRWWRRTMELVLVVVIVRYFAHELGSVVCVARRGIQRGYHLGSLGGRR